MCPCLGDLLTSEEYEARVARHGEHNLRYTAVLAKAAAHLGGPRLFMDAYFQGNEWRELNDPR